LNAELLWPSTKQSQPTYHSASHILRSLLPKVADQLSEMGFPKTDFAPLLTVIEERLHSQQTGAQWQLDTLSHLEANGSKTEALHEMLKLYQDHSTRNTPVAQWPLPNVKTSAKNSANRSPKTGAKKS
jgi:hypothetical protein